MEESPDRKLLIEVADYLWNPFEPDNQSKIYHKVRAALVRGPQADASSRAMFIERLANAPGELWSSAAVLRLLNDCDMLASREAK